jgi:hypothetical protein
MAAIAKQLHQLMTHGLLNHQQTALPLTIAPPMPVALCRQFRRDVPGSNGLMMFAQVSC